MNIRQIIISTESNPVVLTRAKKIGLSAIVNTYNKQKALVDYCQECYIDMKKVIYVGNDINDLDAMNVCGMVVVPSDAHPSVKKVADVVLNTPGGGGVIRELMDLIIASIYSN